jgi:Ca-activated chloride channel family protein
MKHIQSAKIRATRRGAMLVLVAVCLPLCIIMAAFAINVAWMQLVRTELRTSTDAAARAGAKQLSLSQSTSVALAQAKDLAKRNQVAGQGLLLADSDIEFGSSTQANDLSRFNFIPGAKRPNAVRVTGQRAKGSLAGPVDLLMAGVFSVKQFEPKETAVSTQLDRDICLVVDRSGSMMWTLIGHGVLPPGAPDCGPPDPTRSRWGALNIAVEAFLQQLEATGQDERVGLVSYSSNTSQCGFNYNIADINSDLVSNYAPIRTVMKNLSSRPVKGATAISAGIDDGITVLTGKKARAFAVKTMILMTDGIHNLGPEPVLSARVAKTKDIVIHTITFSDDADIKRMEDVAAATGGRHFHAPTAADLISIFKEIAATLPVLLTN